MLISKCWYIEQLDGRMEAKEVEGSGRESRVARTEPDVRDGSSSGYDADIIRTQPITSDFPSRVAWHCIGLHNFTVGSASSLAFLVAWTNSNVTSSHC
jgi:hypothetical protein